MKLNNFFTKKLDTLPINTKIYLCGPTTYNHAHIGNLRPIVIFDILHRVLLLEGKPLFVHNITDIDDKIITKAKEEHQTEKQISDFYTKAYLKLLEQMNIIMPDFLPKVTNNVEGIIDFVQKLIAVDVAYVVDGNVYFAIDKWENYGKIANIDLKELSQNEDSINKKNPFDFALWKNTTEGLKFPSPWGEGRPGWHTECSYFVSKFFNNETIDLHGGGIDLRFPHHVNEAAQFEAINHKKLANTWMYVGHVNMGNDKMSKSEGNTILAKDFIKQYNSNLLRLILISTHYAKPIQITNNLISTSQNKLAKIEMAFIKGFRNLSTFNFKQEDISDLIAPLVNDLDIPNTFTLIEQVIKNINNANDNLKLEQELNRLHQVLNFLGFEVTLNHLEINKFMKALKEKDFITVDELKTKLVII